MPLPVAASQRAAINPNASEGPPPEAPDWLETAYAGVRMAQDDVSGAMLQHKVDAHAPIIQALIDHGKFDRSRYYNMGRMGEPVYFDTVWRDVEAMRARDPKAFSGIGSREDFEKKWRGDVAARQARDQGTLARGSGVASFIGGMAGALTDPINLLTMPFGGGGKTLGQVALREFVLNGAIEAAQQPLVMAERAQQGRALTAEEAGMNIAMGAAGGAVLGSAFKASGDLMRAGGPRGLIESVLANNWDRLPESVRTRWESAASVPERDIPDLAEMVIGRENMTEAEADAVRVLRREDDIEAGAPMMPNGAAAELHPRLLGERLDNLLANAGRGVGDGGGKPAFVPGVSPVVPAGRRASTAIVPPPVGRTGGVGDRSSLIRFVIDDLEGGDKLVRDSGGLTKWGVSENGNPGVDIANLTRGEAEAIYARKYWIAELDGLDRDAAAVAFDASVNHGPGFARRIIAASQGDAAKMLQMRRAEYARLLRDEPAKYGRYRNGWENRLRKLEGKLGRAPGSAGSMLEADPRAAAEGLQGELDALAARIADLDEQLARSPTGADGEAGPLARADEPVTTTEPDAAPIFAEPAPREPDLPGKAAPVADALVPEIDVLLPSLRAAVADRGRSLAKIDQLAEELGTTPDRVREGLEALIAEGRITRNAKTGNFMRKAPPPRTLANRKRPRTLIEWQAERGGFWDGDPAGGADGTAFRGGDLRAIGLTPGDRRVGKRVLRRAEDGHGDMGLDNVLRDAVEAGYFPELQGRLGDAYGSDSFDVQLLIDAIADELAGRPRYAQADVEAGRVKEFGLAAADRAETELDLATDLLRADSWVAMGDFADDELQEIAAIMLDSPGMTPAQAADAWMNEQVAAARDRVVEETGDGRYGEYDYDEIPFDLADDAGFARDRRAADDAAGRGGPARDGRDAQEGGAAGAPDRDPFEQGARLADQPEGARTAFLDPEGVEAARQADSLAHDWKAKWELARAAIKREVLAALDTARDTLRPVVDLRAASNIDEARAVWREHIAGRDLVNVESGLRGSLARGGIEKMTSKSAVDASSSPVEHLIAVANADRIFETGRIIHSGPDTKAILKAEASGSDPRGLGVVAIHRIAARIDAPDGPVAALLTVKETTGSSANAIYTVQSVNAWRSGGGKGAESGPGPLAPPEGGIELAAGQNLQAGRAGPATDISQGGALDKGAAVDPDTAARQAQEVRLAADAPLRGANRTGQAQDGVYSSDPAAPGLFDAVDQPTFRLEVEGEGIDGADLLQRIDEDVAENATIRECM